MDDPKTATIGFPVGMVTTPLGLLEEYLDFELSCTLCSLFFRK